MKRRVYKKISFQTLDYYVAIVVSDIVCDLVKSKSIEKALEIKKDKIVESLGGLPLIKNYCSLLAIDALATRGTVPFVLS